MAKNTKYLSVREIENAYEIQIQASEFNTSVEEETSSIIAMLFFQTRSHIQLDVSSLDYIPLSFITQILRLAKDLRSKRRVLVLLGLPLSTHHFLQRFGMARLFFQTKDGMLRTSFENPLLPREGSQG